MKKITLFIICFILQIFIVDLCAAQNQHKIDSLQDLINKHPQQDTTRVKLLLDLGSIIQMADPEKNKFLIDEVLQISNSLNYEYGTAFGHLRLGLYHSIKGANSLGLNEFRKSLAIAEKIKSDYIIGIVLGHIGTYCYKSGKTDSALFYYKKSVDILEKTDNKGSLGGILSNTGGIYMTKGDYQKALDYFLKARRYLEESNSKLNLSYVYYNLSDIYLEVMKDSAAAKEYAEKTLSVSEESGNMIGIASGNERLGELEKDPLTVRHYFTNALLVYEKLNNKDDMAREMTNLGRSFLYLQTGKNYDSAIAYLQESLLTNAGDQFVLASAHENIGFAFQKKGDYKSSIKHYLIALEIARKTQNSRMIVNVMSGLSTAYAASGNYKQAYQYYSSFSDLKDSTLDEEKIKSLSEMSARYESEKKEKEIALLTKDKQIQNIEIKRQKFIKNSLIGGVILLVILSIVLFTNFRVKNKLRLQSIRNKIAGDLHDDIGSTLNSISVYSEVAKQKSPAVVPELEQIGDASRKIIDAMSDIVWTINPNNDSFENIILRMRSLSYNLLKAKNIEHIFRADESLESMKLSIENRRNFFLIYKESVNNLVKYSEATRVAINLSHENDFVKLSVRDNGKGFNIKQFSTGNGLLNMKRRADEMNAELKIESETGAGTNIELILKA